MQAVLSRCDAQADDPEELLAMASGSPGALLAHRERWGGLPAELIERLGGRPASAHDALALARDLTESLDGEQQLWLLDWWQHKLWSQCGDDRPLRRLETLRRHLLGLVQPRLAWEVALLELVA